ncbi:tRNA (adenosine(37)-N6)-threonylcarbamoyltransferase complex ATPase subunit type 1 TsaE [Candidatus Aminicenantes bacterium AC-335-A11]|jgi:tRNA threonylcarbamoyladenosine biosynthesis protein TsaE|nr:tRNA (adenosine(37)-N6)-threonylcarbamoyltransferase complex ATPase subunit type 1 TsaE [SCandidatus Aminicenantes bacterium Aminicenantia_JdfR_composite]MCP2596981.1 tRNA (adenosine(37)-N6)-threonylcarbamoyltransferase complex ATPase subunit type 1 TsaE [Candidatus Aminicenantes bacterium AC-335-G13]MCP2605927.1 tRNA (adenosine(37)-N6)-threonylcarbamoyltransferase complex ATPase subunit type 1 TsaE [Candidatus Aminicenantes bacterium AC-708-I09]MCP2618266.1 tRNA (adenosine(37)-N6)-threonylca
MNNKNEFITNSEEETFSLAKNLGSELIGKEVILLIGELGAGKTIFAKGIASGAGVEDVTEVCSPSYTILNIYEGKFPIYHFDLYRLSDIEEIEDLGWEDYIGEGVVIIEWGEKVSFPNPDIKIEIQILGNNRRKIRIFKFKN